MLYADRLHFVSRTDSASSEDVVPEQKNEMEETGI